MTKNSVTFVIPCLNEEQNIPILIERLKCATKNIPNINFTYLFVDDGSSDSSFKLLKKLSTNDNSIKVIMLSRNFGSHIAITAGIENANDSDAIIVISSDLQEPPELTSKLIDKWQDGFEVVWTIRKIRAQSFIEKFISSLFHKLFFWSSGLRNYPKEGPSGFFLLDNKVSRNWYKFKESNRMIFGMIAWMGFNQTSIKYIQEYRTMGKSSYTIYKLIKLSIDSIVSFSFAPIRFVIYLGITISLIGFVYALFLIVNWFYTGTTPEGWTQIMVAILFLGGLQLITLGIIGEYIWRGVEESRNRPLYLISEKINCS